MAAEAAAEGEELKVAELSPIKTPKIKTVEAAPTVAEAVEDRLVLPRDPNILMGPQMDHARFIILLGVLRPFVGGR